MSSQLEHGGPRKGERDELDVFSMPEWRKYCDARVEVTTDDQKEKLKRLLDKDNPEVETAWRNLAADVKRGWFTEQDGTSNSLEWSEALHNVLDCILLTPSIITPPNKSACRKILKAAEALHDALKETHLADLYGITVGVQGLDSVIAAARSVIDGNMPQPLIPGKVGEKSEANWLALYLRERIVSPFFNQPHHEDIARLVSAALQVEISPDSVRKLKPRSRSHP